MNSSPQSKEFIGFGTFAATRFSWRYLLSLFVVCASLSSASVFASGTERTHDEDRQQLRALMAEVEAGINAQNVDRLTAMMADDVTVTWLNAEVSRGKPEVKAYYSRMVGGESAILKKYETKVSLGAPARFYGDVAVAEGIADDAFYPHKRDPFHLDSRWSSTLGKIDGTWKIVTLNLSANVFTNPLMAEAERWIWFAGAGGFVLGVLAAGLFVFLRRR
ncbi:MAG: nuclear transport factor 2 family protein [Propionivibrio sp.]|nr:nuclear transport factor 2 family protein [Propionivibrio sp.]